MQGRALFWPAAVLGLLLLGCEENRSPEVTPGQPLAGTATVPVKHGTDGIEVLMDKLATIKAQKAELDKVEKQTVALLREKLKHQKERLQKLGVEPQEATPTSAPATSVTTSELPTPEKPR